MWEALASSSQGIWTSIGGLINSVFLLIIGTMLGLFATRIQARTTRREAVDIKRWDREQERFDNVEKLTQVTAQGLAVLIEKVNGIHGWVQDINDTIRSVQSEIRKARG